MTTMSHWGELLSDLLRQISNRLNFVDRVRFCLICKHWQRSAAFDRPVDPVPWLWIPPQNDEPDGIKRENRIYNPADGHVHRTGLFSEENIGLNFCVGSSHGHLIFFHYYIPTHCARSNYFPTSIFNPLTGARTPLPEIRRDFGPLFSRRRTIAFINEATRKRAVHKAILTSDPTHARFAAVLLFGGDGDYGGRGISFCVPSSDFSWSELEGADSAPYHDVVARNGLLFALAGDYFVEVWNLRWEDFDYAVKVTTFSPLVPERFGELEYGRSRFYVVTGGDDAAAPVLVVRILGEFVYCDGNVVAYSEMVEEATVWWYRTVGFEVYKMDGDRRNWVRMMSLSDGEEERALFLGGSHSVSVVASGEIAADCIYFTDDSWDMMTHYNYNGHHFGVFDLRSGKVRRFDCELEENRFDPSPSWLVPSLRNYSM